MQAHSRIVACADTSAGSRAGRAGFGATVLAELRGEPPLLPRVTGSPGAPVAEVHLVGGAAGPLGGDELVLDVEVGPGASLVLRTVAATVALPGPNGLTSTTTVRARVAEGGRLAYLPEPVVAAAGCDHRMTTTVELADGAHLLWREELVCGRYGEQCGDMVLRTTVRRERTTVYRQDLAVGPSAPQWAGPAGLAGNRTCGTVVILDGSARRATTVDGGALMPLAVPGAYVATAVAPVAHELRRTLDRLTGGPETITRLLAAVADPPSTALSR